MSRQKRKEQRQQLSKFQFDESRCPADYDLVLQHYKANKVGVPNIDKNDGKLDYCLCCNKIIEKKKFKFSINTDQLVYLGPIYPIYFYTIKYMIVLLCLIMIPNIAALVMNVHGNHVDTECKYYYKDNWKYKCDHVVSKFSYSNNNDFEYQCIVNLLNVVIIIVANTIYQAKQKINEKIVDQQLITPSDYSILIGNLPTKENKVEGYADLKEQIVREQIQGWFDKHSELWEEYKKQNKDIHDKGLKCEIERIVYAYDLDQYQSLLKQKYEVIQELQQVKRGISIKIMGDKIKQGIKKNFKRFSRVFSIDKAVRQKTLHQMDFAEDRLKIEELENKKKEIIQKIDDMEDDVAEGDFKLSLGFAIVTFNSQDVRKFFMQNMMMDNKQIYNQKLRLLFSSKEEKKKVIESKMNYNGRMLKVIRCPEPGDIIWENLNITTMQKMKNKLFYNAILFLFVFTSIGCLLLIQIYDDSLINALEIEYAGHKKQVESYINMAVSLLITIVNKMLQFGVVYLTEKEKFMTHTNFQIVIAERLSNAQFINTSIIILVVEIFIRDRHLYDANGIGYNIISIAVSVAITTSLLNFLDFGYLFTKFKRKAVIKSYMKSKSKQQNDEAISHAVKINQNNHAESNQNASVSQQQEEVVNNDMQKQSNDIMTYKDDEPLIDSQQQQQNEQLSLEDQNDHVVVQSQQQSKQEEEYDDDDFIPLDNMMKTQNQKFNSTGQKFNITGQKFNSKSGSNSHQQSTQNMISMKDQQDHAIKQLDSNELSYNASKKNLLTYKDNDENRTQKQEVQQTEQENNRTNDQQSNDSLNENFQHVMSQKEAHSLFTNPEFDIRVKYAQLFNIGLLSMFYSCYQPLITLICILGLVLFFYTEKYLVVNRYSESANINPKINGILSDQIKRFAVVYSAGSILFHFIEHKRFNNILIIDFVLLIVSVVYLILPTEQLVTKVATWINKAKIDTTQSVLYKDAKVNFVLDYARANPITSFDEIEAWLKQSHEQEEKRIHGINDKQKGSQKDPEMDREQMQRLKQKMKTIDDQKYIKKIQKKDWTSLVDDKYQNNSYDMLANDYHGDKVARLNKTSQIEKIDDLV